MSRSWIKQAACVGAPNFIFFPEQLTNNRWDKAKQICAVCNVRTECLALVMRLEDGEDKWGVFGGLNPAERSDLRWKKYLKKV